MAQSKEDKDDCASAINAIKRVQRKWEWLERTYPAIAEEATEACKPGRPKKPEGDIMAGEVPLGQFLVAAYCRAWKARYGTNPHVGGMVAKQLKTLGEEAGRANAERYILGYLQMNDSWYIKNRHDVPRLIQNVNAVKLFCEKNLHIVKRRGPIS